MPAWETPKYVGYVRKPPAFPSTAYAQAGATGSVRRGDLRSRGIADRRMRAWSERRQPIFRHALVSIVFLLAYLLLTRPSIIFYLRPGFTAWYPATGLVLALLLGVSPRYAILAAVADWLSGFLTYRASPSGFMGTVAPLGPALCYGIAAYVLRGPLRLDLRLQRRADVVRFVFVGAAAAAASTLIATTFLALDHIIHWRDYWTCAAGWFWGDGVGLLGVAPFLLIYVCPWVRRWVSGVPDSAEDWGSPSPGGPRLDVATVVEGAGQIASLLAVLWVIFGPRWSGEQLLFLTFVPII
jgi:hypothetical protein